jgi:L-rhamnose mutarotase
MLALFQCEDYPRWKSVFDKATDAQKAAGVKSYQLFHIEKQTNNLVLIFEFDTMENARDFMFSPEMEERMWKAGVIGFPNINFMEKT